MLSKSHLHMRKILNVVSKMYNVVFFEEVKEGNKKYDFYFPTSPPFVIEIDGTQHNLNGADGFFFKKTKDLLKYKKNDEERNNFDKLGRIKLLRFTTDDFPTIDEMENIINGNNINEILEGGNDEYNIFYQRFRRNKEQSEERKRINKEYRKKFKERNSNFNRFK